MKIDECTWCNGTSTEWVINDEPDPHYDFPDHNIDADTVRVNLIRYCRSCECNYEVTMEFNIREGRRVDHDDVD